jgi:hypothetical protein
MAVTDQKANVSKAVPAQEPLVKRLDKEPLEEKQSMTRTMMIVYMVLILLGAGTGYLLARTGPDGGLAAKKGEMIQTDSIVGIADSQTFKDSAEGTVAQGGINGEGTHQLLRDGGPSQTVYLTSSVVDLEEFVGKKVTVWGQTMDAQQAGWLMDVGKVETK